MKTEAGEARWFEDNQDSLLKLFEQAELENVHLIRPEQDSKPDTPASPRTP
jgi:hypothetical protein